MNEDKYAFFKEPEVTLWRMYFFNEQMEIVHYEDTVRAERSASAMARRIAKRKGYYTFAVGRKL
jgi:hypothetical protein